MHRQYNGNRTVQARSNISLLVIAFLTALFIGCEQPPKPVSPHVSHDLTDALNRADEITELNIGNQQLVRIPPEIGKLAHVELIFMDRNNLTTLPQEFGNLNHLIELHMEMNKFDSIPSCVFNLDTLLYLHMGWNKLSYVAPEISKLSHVTNLFFNDNQITTLPTEMQFMKSLESVDLGGNPISKDEQRRLIKLLPNIRIYF
jgi:Leucine-rich repeat (LRR) protein